MAKLETAGSSTWWRTTLLAAGVGLAACAVSLLLQTQSASAEEPADSASGVLGVVNGALSDAGSLTDAVGTAADSALTTAVTAVSPVAAPVTAVLPSPVAAVVTQAVSTAHSVAPVTEALDAGVTGVVNATSSALSTVAGAGAVTEVTAIVNGLPVVGSLTSGIRADVVIDELAGGLDTVLADVVGAPGEALPGIIPGLPLGGLDAVAILFRDQTSTAHLGLVVARSLIGGALPSGTPPLGAASSPSILWAGALVAAGLVVGVAGTPAPFAPGGRSAPAGGSTGSSASGSGAAFAAIIEHPASVPNTLIYASQNTDDALPGAPVFDTDVSPD